MCIIVDANRLGAFLANPVDADAKPVRAWLNRGARRRRGRFRGNTLR